VATIYATLLTTGAEILLLVFATPMTAIFAHDPLLLAEATFALRVAMLAQFLVGAQFMWMTALQGMRRGGEALALSLLRQLIVLIPAIIILSHFFGLKGIWVSMPVSDAIAFGITFAWILAVRRKVGVVSPQAPATPAL
jgi:Na+-driven multidrug efflux pump